MTEVILHVNINGEVEHGIMKFSNANRLLEFFRKKYGPSISIYEMDAKTEIHENSILEKGIHYEIKCEPVVKVNLRVVSDKDELIKEQQLFKGKTVGDIQNFIKSSLGLECFVKQRLFLQNPENKLYTGYYSEKMAPDTLLTEFNLYKVVVLNYQKN